MAELKTFEKTSPESLFDVDYNEGLIHQAVTTHEANQRVDLASTKSRSEVSGRNKKPWRQKGTGRARHGSRISPLWVGGGQAHAPSGEHNHSKKLTKTMKRQALRSALSQRRREEAIHIIEDIDLEEPNTSKMDNFFKQEDLDDKKVLLCLTTDEKQLKLSSRNLPYCDPLHVENLNTYEIVSHTSLVFTEEAMEQVQSRFTNGTQ